MRRRSRDPEDLALSTILVSENGSLSCATCQEPLNDKVELGSIGLCPNCNDKPTALGAIAQKVHSTRRPFAIFWLGILLVGIAALIAAYVLPGAFNPRANNDYDYYNRIPGVERMVP